MVAGLTESMRGEWGGDVDLGDGELAKRFSEYSELILTVKGMCGQLTDSVERSHTLLKLGIIKKALEDDLEFVPTGL